MTRWSRIGRRNAAAPPAPKMSAKSPARTKSRGGRKAPAAPAPARSNRRCGSAAAWFSVPSPRDFAKKISKKTRALALRKALSERLKAGDVMVVDDLKLASPKTKDFVGVMSALDLKGTTLFVSSGDGQKPHARLAQHSQRRADHERFAEHLRRFAARQIALYQERV